MLFLLSVIYTYILLRWPKFSAHRYGTHSSVSTEALPDCFCL